MDDATTDDAMADLMARTSKMPADDLRRFGSWCFKAAGIKDALALKKAAQAVADDACSLICPSTGKAGEPIPHSDRCKALRAAIAAVQQ